MNCRKAINHLAGLVLGFLCLQALAAEPARVQLLDRVVAVVNHEVITQFELDARTQVIIQQIQRQGGTVPPREVIQPQILERMVTERVQLQFAAETGIRVDNTQLDKTIQRIAEQNQMSLEAFRAALEKDGVSFVKFREEIRDEIILSRLREREVDNRIAVSDGELDSFLGPKAGQQGHEDEYNLAHILITLSERANPEEIQQKRARAEQAVAELQGGADFAKVAAKYSNAPDALEGGAMGWRPAARLPGLFLDAVSSLRPGQLTPILRSPAGFHVLKLLDRRGTDAPFFVARTSARHILIKTNEVVSEEDAKRRILALKERLVLGNDKFEDLARLHSEDVGSATRGGDLGWLSPGDTVPEFEAAMNALKPGQIGEPVRTQFGFHLIQVLDRRDEDVSRERQRLQARMQIRQRKADEAYQEWLRQLRDRAYVEIRLEDKY
jgi:peptidyl-prolyl cis-trans isomerase SurA